MALETITPPIDTGSSLATGVTAPVRPTLGSIFSIINSEHEMVAAGCFKYSYLQELVLSVDNETILYQFTEDKKWFQRVKQIITPKNGEHYFVNESKKNVWNDYYIHQLNYKLYIHRSHHQLILPN